MVQTAGLCRWAAPASDAARCHSRWEEDCRCWCPSKFLYPGLLPLIDTGDKLVSERKEPAEILEVYDSTRLQFFGNSSHLAPWHAKLGFVKIPYVATFDSLTCDGGLVTLMDVTVTKVSK